MRSFLLVCALAACGPKVSPQPLTFDEDLGDREQRTTVAATAPEEAPRSEAPPGKGLRTGTIARARLIEVLDQGPAQFLRQLEVTPRLDGQRFVGWELVQLLDRNGPLVDVDVVPGDVLLAVNGQPLSRPDQLQSVWDSLRTANVVRAKLWRGNAKVTLDFAIEPAVAQPVAPAAPLPAAAPTAGPAPATKPAPATTPATK